MGKNHIPRIKHLDAVVVHIYSRAYICRSCVCYVVYFSWQSPFVSTCRVSTYPRFYVYLLIVFSMAHLWVFLTLHLSSESLHSYFSNIFIPISNSGPKCIHFLYISLACGHSHFINFISLKSSMKLNWSIIWFFFET